MQQYMWVWGGIAVWLATCSIPPTANNFYNCTFSHILITIFKIFSLIIIFKIFLWLCLEYCCVWDVGVIFVLTGHNGGVIIGYK